MSDIAKVIKLEYCGIIRRTHNVPVLFKDLLKLVQATYPELFSTPFQITYKDEDNDTITLFDDTDLQEAYMQLKESNKSTIKFLVAKKIATEGKESYVEEIKKDIAPIEVICDGCNALKKGVRKCVDGNLCKDCEDKGMHMKSVVGKNNHLEKVYSDRATSLKRFSSEPSNTPMLPELFSDLWGHIDGTHCLSTLKKGKWEDSDYPPRGITKRMGIVAGGKEILSIESTPGMIVNAQWQLKNDTERNWPKFITILKKRGNIDFDPIWIQGHNKPEEEIDLTVPITAPNKPGEYELKLIMNAEEGYKIGKSLIVKLSVKSKSMLEN